MKKYLLILLIITFFCLLSNICLANTVKVFNLANDQEELQFQPYGENFYGAVNLAVGDFNGDGQKEIVTAPGNPGQSQIRFFSAAGNPIGGDFFAFNPNFRGGTVVAVGDINGDQQDELIVAPENRAQTEVKIYRHQAGQFQLLNSFLAFPPGFTGGASLTCYDLDQDGRAEIIVGAGSNGSPQVRVFQADGRVINQFLAFAPDFTGGVTVSAGNIDQDEFGEIITAPRKGAPQIRVFDHRGQLQSQFYAFNEKFRGGISLAIINLETDNIQEIAVGTYKGAPQIRIFDAAGQAKKQFFAYEQEKRHGTRQTNLGQKLIVAQGKDLSRVKKIALTFDDGYSSSGSFGRILDILKANDVPATFFMLGKVAQISPDIMRRIVHEGHLIANHSYTHAIYTRIPESQMIGEILTTERIIKDITGVQTKHFRFPGGGHNSFTDQVVEGLGYKWYQWNISAADAAKVLPTQEEIFWNVAGHLRNNGTVLMHTQSSNTAQTLNRIIQTIRAQGYEFVTVDDLDYYNG